MIGANGRLRLSNPAFGSMWQIPAHELENESHISEIANHISDLIGDSDAMNADKQQLTGLLTDRKSRSGRMERIDGSVLDYATVPLPDGAVLLRFSTFRQRLIWNGLCANEMKRWKLLTG